MCTQSGVRQLKIKPSQTICHFRQDQSLKDLRALPCWTGSWTLAPDLDWRAPGIGDMPAMLGFAFSRMKDACDQARQQTAIMMQRLPGANMRSTEKLFHEPPVGQS